MAGDRLIQECPQPTRDDVALGLSGNLCRCTGYYRFYDAVEQAVDPASAPVAGP
jgi:carbon-monoxide dehydrogenase small subunit